MNKVGCLLLVILVLYIGYNEWRVSQMRANFEAVAVKNGTRPKPTEPKAKGLLDPLANGRRHAQRAEKLLREKHYDQAADELTKALTNLKEAQDSAEGMLGGAKGALERAREGAANTVEKVREGISGLAGKKKTEKEAPKKP